MSVVGLPPLQVSEALADHLDNKSFVMKPPPSHTHTLNCYFSEGGGREWDLKARLPEVFFSSAVKTVWSVCFFLFFLLTLPTWYYCERPTWLQQWGQATAQFGDRERSRLPGNSGGTGYWGLPGNTVSQGGMRSGTPTISYEQPWFGDKLPLSEVDKVELRFSGISPRP